MSGELQNEYGGIFVDCVISRVRHENTALFSLQIASSL